MPDFILDHTQHWMDYFAGQGHDPEPLVSGFEGAVYDLGNDLVAKVWRDRRAGDLFAMQEFYVDVAAAALPFARPRSCMLSKQAIRRSPMNGSCAGASQDHSL